MQLNEKKIFGVTGKAGHGKDTLCKLIQEIDTSFTVLHFADELKSIAMDVFGLSEYDVYNPEGKEKPLPEPIDIDRHLLLLQNRTGLTLRTANKFASTPRQLLQYLGTDYVRKASPTYWLDIIMKKANALGGKVLIPDTRFLNEAETIRKLGGQVIRVTRSDGLLGSSPAHASEVEQESIKADLTVLNTYGDMNTLKFFAQAIAKLS